MTSVSLDLVNILDKLPPLMRKLTYRDIKMQRKGKHRKTSTDHDVMKLIQEQAEAIVIKQREEEEEKNLNNELEGMNKIAFNFNMNEIQRMQNAHIKKVGSERRPKLKSV